MKSEAEDFENLQFLKKWFKDKLKAQIFWSSGNKRVNFCYLQSRQVFQSILFYKLKMYIKYFVGMFLIWDLQSILKFHVRLKL